MAERLGELNRLPSLLLRDVRVVIVGMARTIRPEAYLVRPLAHCRGQDMLVNWLIKDGVVNGTIPKSPSKILILFGRWRMGQSRANPSLIGGIPC